MDPERRIALGYAPGAVRDALATLFALDERLAGIVARTTEPTIGLMRLVWWRDALDALATTVPDEPLLIACAALAARGVAGADLAAMVEGWAVLLDDPDLADETVAIHASERGGRLFAVGGRLLGAGADQTMRLSAGGEGWARADLARHCRDEARAAAILESARGPLTDAGGAWPRSLRPLGQLAMLACDDTRRGIGRRRPPASPARLLRILRFHLIGR